MESKLIDCHVCNRCNELKVVYDKTLGAFNRLVKIEQDYSQRYAQLHDTASQVLQGEHESRQCDFLRSRILLMQTIENVEAAVSTGLQITLEHIKEDLEFGRIKNELESQIMKLNYIAAQELVSAIAMECCIARARLENSDKLMPELLLTLEAVFTKKV